MQSTAELSLNKSTNVRPKTSRQRQPQAAGAVLAAIRTGLNLGHAVSPALATRLAERLFFSPRRYRLPLREELDLASAQRFELEVSGQRLVAYEWGIGAPVALVHGWEGRGSQLAGVVPYLVAAGYKVLAFDAPAHGASPGKRTNVLELSAALLALSRRSGPLHAVVAHSLGCMATSLALQDGLVAGRVVYLAPWSSLNLATRSFGEKVGIVPELMERVQASIERRFAHRLADLDGLVLARRMRTPALVVHDTDDREVSFEEGRALAETWQGAHLVATSGLGHRRILRDPEVVRRVAAFVEHGDELVRRDPWREVLAGA